MSTIPSEILTKTFKQLNSYDLVQCQLVCRSWNQASLKVLYSDINIHSENECQLYVRTINSSPHLGKYLEVIKADIIYNNEDINYNPYEVKEEEEEEGQLNLWNRHGLLDTVINHCPNVLQILNESPTPFFLTRLMNAGLQGQLSRLEYVTTPGIDAFYYYAKTVLAFKKTLTTLELPNYVPYSLNGEEAKFLLCKNLNQFPCLQNLEIISCYEYCLSHYDTLFDSCKNLTNFIVHPQSYNEILIPAAPTELLRPHPKIETLQCTWHIINAEEQVAYIMQKFPNLKYLTIDCERFDDMRFSINTLIKLLRYMISLKKGYISITLNLEDCIKPWVSIINEKVDTIDICILISDDPSHGNPNKVPTRFTGKLLALNFYSNTYTDQHIKLLSEIGKKVQSLTMYAYMSPTGRQKNMFQIVKLVKLCPSMQHLELAHSERPNFSRIKNYQNFVLKSLNLTLSEEHVECLKKLSLMFPNLKNLQLFVICAYGSTITIDMPSSNLDSLTCILKDNRLCKHDFEIIYIRLKTDVGTKFYAATEYQLLQINEDECKVFQFDINCRGLIKLRINHVGPYSRLL